MTGLSDAENSSSGGYRGVIRRLISGLRERKLYLLLFVSAVFLFLSFRAGVSASLLDSAPLYSINVGDEDDEGHVEGFHQREWNDWDGSVFRWSKAHSSIILPGARKLPLEIKLAVNGWRPEDQAAPHVRLIAHGQELASFTAEKELRTYEFRYTPPMPSPAKDLVLEIHADTFAPPTDHAKRTLGVLVDSLEATPIAGPWWYADWVSIAALSLAIIVSYLLLHSLGATPSSTVVAALILLGVVCCLMIISAQQVARLSLLLLVLLPALCGVCYAALVVARPWAVQKPSMESIKRWAIRLLVLAFVLWFYAWVGRTAGLVSGRDQGKYYGLLVDAFRAGQLHLPVTPHPELLALPDPYDPVANAAYRWGDLSLYDRKYYLYFGPTPVITLYLPYRLLTGAHPSDWQAILVFMFGALIFATLVLADIRKRWFPRSPEWMFDVSLLVLGFGSLAPFLLRRPMVYEAAIASAVFFLMGGIYCLHSATVEERPSPWRLALGSLFLGLAVGCRPHFALTGILLPLVLWKLWRAGAVAGWRRFWKLSFVLALPFVACGLMLLAYNYARFGSIFEFGMSYQLTGHVNPARAGQSPAVPFRTIITNLYAYLVRLPSFDHKFPFFHMPSGPIPPAIAPYSFHAFETTLGALWAAPYLWLFLPGAYLLADYVIQRMRSAKPADSGLEPGPYSRWPYAALLVGLPPAVILAGLSTFGGTTMRYVADFALPLLLLASIVWLQISTSSLSLGVKRILNSVAIFLAVVTVLFGMAMGIEGIGGSLEWQDPEQYARLERFFAPLASLAGQGDVPARIEDGGKVVYRFRRDRWECYWERLVPGPWRVQMQVRFGTGLQGTEEMLVSTGDSGGSNVIFVQRVSDREVAFGFEQAGWNRETEKPILGEAIVVEPDHFYDLVAIMDQENDIVAVLLDNRDVFQCDCPVFPAGRSQVTVAETRLDEVERESPGPAAFEIRDVEMDDGENWHTVAPEVVRVQMAVRFGTGPVDSQEPLITTGETAAGDFIYIRRVSDTQVAFGFDHWGFGGPAREMIEVDPDTYYTISAEMDYNRNHVTVSVDDEVVLECSCPLYTTRLDQLSVGENLIGGTTVGPEFHGEIQVIRTEGLGRIRVASVVGKVAHSYWDALLNVHFGTGPLGSQEPLITTGQTGAGDFIYIRRVSDTEVAFGFDHWGSRARIGETIEVDPDTYYTISAKMDYDKNEVAVLMNDQVVLQCDSPLYRTGMDQLSVGENLIGGTTVGPEFHGAIQVIRIGYGVRESWRARMQVRFGKGPGYGRGVLEITKEGDEGSAIFVERLSDNKVAFGLADWDSTGSVISMGEGVRIDPRRFYQVEVDLDEREGRVEVLVDGTSVFQGELKVTEADWYQVTNAHNRVDVSGDLWMFRGEIRDVQITDGGD